MPDVTTTSPVAPGIEPAAPPRGWRALAGVLAVAAAIGAGHLVAAVVSPPSSPYLAVGDAAVRLAPEWLVEFAKSAFGTADKAVLLVGMAAVIALVAAAAGLAALRDPRRTTWAITGLGLLGLVAVLFSPTFGLLDLVAPATALLVGPAVFRRLHALAGGAPATTPDDPSRRRLLVSSSVAVGAGALGAAGIGQLLAGPTTTGAGGSRAIVTSALAAAPITQPAPPIPPGADFVADGTPPFITSNADFYRIDTALRVPMLSADDWSLRLHGMVDREITLDFADVMSRPLVQRAVTLVCVSNEVGDDLISTALFTGVDLRALLLEAGVRPGADQVLSTSADGWTAGTPTDVLLEPDRGALLAVGMNGEALPAEHGFPARLVVPGLYGFVSATKWVTDIELTTFAAKTGYWQPRGWARLSPVKTQSRIDFPRGFRAVPAGRVPVAGIAWSQPDGISRVEVRVDGGAWRDTELAADVGGDTWRMWRTDVEVAPGEHVVQVRATDARGVTQTEQIAPPAPDGATGWHGIVFTAR
ncbi:MAG: molybdopterin-dependent oxidoreductase [Pseudonocardia sp.]